MSDTPIVDVPITGGVLYGNTSNQWAGDAPDPGNGSEWGQYQWFNPMAFYCANEDPSNGNCAFWCATCGDDLFPELVNTAELQGEPPQYPAFTPINIEALGVCQIFWQWVFSAWWASVTGNQEGPPQALTGSGGGTGPGGGGG